MIWDHLKLLRYFLDHLVTSLSGIFLSKPHSAAVSWKMGRWWQPWNDVTGMEHLKGQGKEHSNSELRAGEGCRAGGGWRCREASFQQEHVHTGPGVLNKLLRHHNTIPGAQLSSRDAESQSKKWSAFPFWFKSHFWRLSLRNGRGKSQLSLNGITRVWDILFPSPSHYEQSGSLCHSDVNRKVSSSPKRLCNRLENFAMTPPTVQSRSPPGWSAASAGRLWATDLPFLGQMFLISPSFTLFLHFISKKVNPISPWTGDPASSKPHGTGWLIPRGYLQAHRHLQGTFSNALFISPHRLPEANSPTSELLTNFATLTWSAICIWVCRRGKWVQVSKSEGGVPGLPQGIYNL